MVCSVLWKAEGRRERRREINEFILVHVVASLPTRKWRTSPERERELLLCKTGKSANTISLCTDVAIADVVVVVPMEHGTKRGGAFRDRAGGTNENAIKQTLPILRERRRKPSEQPPLFSLSLLLQQLGVPLISLQKLVLPPTTPTSHFLASAKNSTKRFGARTFERKHFISRLNILQGKN